MNLGLYHRDNYTVELHSKKILYGGDFYHLLLKPEQKNDTKGIKRFTTMAEVYDANLNEQLTNFLSDLLKNGALYIKVIIPE